MKMIDPDPRVVYLISVLERLYPGADWWISSGSTVTWFRGKSILDKKLMIDLTIYHVCVDHSPGWSWQCLDFSDDNKVCDVIKGLLDGVLSGY